MQLRYTFPTGAQVSIDGGDHALLSEPTMAQPLQFGTWTFELLVGRPELAEAIAAETTGVELSIQYTTPFGVLRIGSHQWIDEESNSFSVRMGALFADQWVMVSHFYGPSLDDDVLRFVSEAKPSFGERGVTVDLNGHVRLLEPGYIAQQIAGVGILELTQATNRTLLDIPSRRGAPVAGGEMFVDQTGHVPVAVVVNSTCIFRLQPAVVFDDSGDDIASRVDLALDVASSLMCSWV